MHTHRNRYEYLVRQERISLYGSKIKLNINGELYDIIDISAFGLSFESNTSKEIKKNLNDCSICMDGIEIKKFDMRIVRSELLGINKKYACELTKDSIPLNKIEALVSALNVIEKHNDISKMFASIPNEFRLLVSDMKNWLSKLEEKVDHLEDQHKFNTLKDKSSFEKIVAHLLGEHIVNVFQTKYLRLNEIFIDCDDETKETCIQFFRTEMINLLLKAPFHDRAFNKPLGYSGDYQMMNQIYTNETLGDTLFAKCLHLYFISAPESRAVRNRGNYLLNLIENFTKDSNKNKISILSVASGPAFEICKFLEKNNIKLKSIEFTLLDQDLESLQFAQKKIKEIQRNKDGNISVSFKNLSIKRVITKGLQEKFDLIYSAGLFDYFVDPIATAAADKLYSCLNDDGKLVIGNFSDKSDGQLTMDIALDWKLIYRSKDQLSKLFKHIANDFYIEHEEEGINLFCHLNK